MPGVGGNVLLTVIVRLGHALDVPAVLPGGFLQQLRLLRGAFQGDWSGPAGLTEATG